MKISAQIFVVIRKTRRVKNAQVAVLQSHRELFPPWRSSMDLKNCAVWSNQKWPIRPIAGAQQLSSAAAPSEHMFLCLQLTMESKVVRGGDENAFDRSAKCRERLHKVNYFVDWRYILSSVYVNRMFSDSVIIHNVGVKSSSTFITTTCCAKYDPRARIDFNSSPVQFLRLSPMGLFRIFQHPYVTG